MLQPIPSRAFVSIVTTALFLAPSGANATQLLVPAYFLPGADWSALTTAAGTGAPITAIMNPDSGPGTAADPSYTAAVSSFELAGGKVMGYVYTQGGSRSLSAVESDIKSYESFYPVEGFFLDQMSDDTKKSHLNYYQSLYNFIKGQSASYTVIGNPGTATPSNYANLADTLVTYENLGSSYSTNTQITWSSSQPASKFANIAYQVPDATTMFADLAQARSQNVGYAYFTDDGADGNPYDSLPSYFSQEVSAVVPEPTLIVTWLGAALLLFRPIRERGDQR